MCRYLLFCAILVNTVLLSSCASYAPHQRDTVRVAATQPPAPPPPNYSARLPSHLNVSQKTILIDPNVHAWGAYDSSGDLIRAGLATAGADYCPDIKRPCRTKAGHFRIQSLGSPNCKSTIYPLPKGGAPMPYCMFFNGNQGLHGSPYVMEANASHGCVRLHVEDAEWIRYNFAGIGTPVIVRPY